MPFIPNTPESMIARSDSKNPAATCRGLTSNGRPCRRAISKSPAPSPSSSPLRTQSPELFCWQHRNQALAGASAPSTQPSPIRERTSVDTLIDRLGLLDIETQKEQDKKRRRPVQNVSDGKGRVENKTGHKLQYQVPAKSPKLRPKRKSNLGTFCCIGVTDDGGRAPRPVNVPKKTPRRSTLPPKMDTTHRPPIRRDPSSRTREFLSLIPPSTSPQTTALLLAELAKPVSELDEDGFIYIFWLTSESLPSTPPSHAATSLLVPSSNRSPGQRRPSDVLNTYGSLVPNSTSSRKTILLKIGRAQNVQRRLNQWTRQCGYNLSLIRYYPYLPTTPSTTNVNEPPKTPRRVPNAHKIERLIHIELNEKRAQGSGKCAVCFREHREWFEVEATKEAVKMVDEIVRRWVEWGEREVLR